MQKGMKDLYNKNCFGYCVLRFFRMAASRSLAVAGFLAAGAVGPWDNARLEDDSGGVFLLLRCVEGTDGEDKEPVRGLDARTGLRLGSGEEALELGRDAARLDLLIKVLLTGADLPVFVSNGASMASVLRDSRSCSAICPRWRMASACRFSSSNFGFSLHSKRPPNWASRLCASKWYKWTGWLSFTRTRGIWASPIFKNYNR